MAVTGYEYLIVETENTTCDLIVWRRYKMRARGIVEKLLDANPHLAKHHRNGPFIPVGVQVRIPIDPEIMRGWPGESKSISLWGQN